VHVSSHKNLLPTSLLYCCPLLPSLVIVMESKHDDSSLVDFITFLQVLIAFAVIGLSQDIPIPNDIVRPPCQHNLPCLATSKTKLNVEHSPAKHAAPTNSVKTTSSTPISPGPRMTSLPLPKPTPLHKMLPCHRPSTQNHQQHGHRPQIDFPTGLPRWLCPLHHLAPCMSIIITISPCPLPITIANLVLQSCLYHTNDHV